MLPRFVCYWQIFAGRFLVEFVEIGVVEFGCVAPGFTDGLSTNIEKKRQFEKEKNYTYLVIFGVLQIQFYRRKSTNLENEF